MRRTLLSIGIGVLIAAAGVSGVVPGARVAAAAEKKGKAQPKEAAGAKADTVDMEKVADALKTFCVKWMGFLETRERDNVKGIKWSKEPSKVSGHYVGYSKEYDCVMKDRSSNGTPIATIQYKEFLYEKAGPSQKEAEQAPPSVVEATEVTEIFRYTKGEWVY
jgi:hypothetical protein